MLRRLERAVTNINQIELDATQKESAFPETISFIDELELAIKSLSRRVSTKIRIFDQGRISLEQDHHQLLTVLEAMVEGVLALDSSESILLANNAAIRLLDLKTTGLQGRPIWEVVRLPQFLEAIRRCQSEMVQQRIEFSVPRTQLTITAVVSRLAGPRTSGSVIVLHDVTELRRLENLRSEFVSNVSHELKTPLAAISAYSETLLDGAIDDTEIARTFVGRISEQAERLHNLILELLELARMESQGNDLELEPINISDYLRLSVEAHRYLAESKELRIEVTEIPESALVMANTDAAQTIIDNLLVNAINYTPNGGSVTITCSREDNWVEFAVRDTGVGIAKENQARIFERFFRVDRARSREVGGTGLGLSIVKHLCQILGGSVSVTSQLGKGSVFTVRLPAAAMESISARS